jgi:hypothetical protein
MNRTIRSLLAVSLGVCLCASVSRAAEEEMVDNPTYKSWAKQKVGTAVTHEQSTAAGAAGTFKSTLTSKLLEVNEDKAVVEISVKLDIAGAPAPPAQKQNILAKIKKSQLGIGEIPEGMKAEAKEKGKEKVSAGGKSYECKVMEFTAEGNGVKSKGKSWTSEEVPGSLVKMESTTTVNGTDMKSTMTLTKVEAK